MPPKKGASMTEAHKQALAEGREQGRAVRAYLEVLDQPKKRGRRRTPESIQTRLGVIAQELPDANALSRVLLLQEQADLEGELAATQKNGSVQDIAALEEGFVQHAKAYSASKGIRPATWRKVGVPSAVLKRAGLA